MEIRSMKRTVPIDQQSSEYVKLLQDKSSIFESFRERKLEKYMEVERLHKDFQVIAYNHLQDLIIEED